MLILVIVICEARIMCVIENIWGGWWKTWSWYGLFSSEEYIWINAFSTIFSFKRFISDASGARKRCGELGSIQSRRKTVFRNKTVVKIRAPWRWTIHHTSQPVFSVFHGWEVQNPVSIYYDCNSYGHTSNDFRKYIADFAKILQNYETLNSNDKARVSDKNYLLSRQLTWPVPNGPPSTLSIADVDLTSPSNGKPTFSATPKH